MLNIREDLVSAYRRSRKFFSHAIGTDYPLNRIPTDKLKTVIAENRRALGQVPVWLDTKTLQHSIFDYGVAPRSLPHINAPLDMSCTYADLLVYFAKELRKPLRYLELGVSVGKTFWQVLSTSTRGRLVGFDIEEINPILEQRLRPEARRQWPTKSGSIKKTPSSFTTFRHSPTESEVNYLCGDILDEITWQALKGWSFNLILSDAFHSAEALHKEWEMMLSLNLLDQEECIVVWDDLNGPMHDWFCTHRNQIADALGTSRAQVRTVFVNGWLGEHEAPHRVGLAVKCR